VARAIARAAAAFVAISLASTPAHAYFENAFLSARTAGLGGAFVAIADDASATVDNCAGLTGITTASFLFSYQKPYGVDGLNEGFAAAVLPAGPVSLGAAWYHRGLDAALSEDRFTLSVARDLKRTAEDASLSIGLNLELARVSAAGEFDAAANATAVGAAVLLRPFAFIGMGYSIRSINEPGLDLVAGGPATPLHRSQALGLSYYWDQRLKVTIETVEATDRVWRGRGGMELTVNRHLAIRAGLEGSRPAAGFGIEWNGIELDAAMRSHETLGSSYIVSLQYRLPAKEGSRVLP